ncbi:M48 family metallopeptidase [Pseudomonas sp. ABC1]|uniref:M48 family metallopeptidase n=1 Tax=Pseudomonas sp. ABC1 TaxID=2748080 RepID=UPI0015C357BB|nr:M48 family metallopeptidase [Pseudomonas sp. ABC1]QLF94762.1 M48 family metallopeptidase [Pseudomonas sp. ABC1]
MRIAGHFMDGVSSARQPATLLVEGVQARLLDADGQPLHTPFPATQLKCSSRVGSTPRFVYLAGDARFETQDNDALDALLEAHKPATGLAHRLESKLRYAVLGLLLSGAFIFSCVQWGVPALAKVAAFALPVSVNQQADRLVMQLLDRQFFEPSTLPAAEQQRLLQVFAPVIQEHAPETPIDVQFRDAEKTIGPNALALPAGTVVFTDQLIRLAQHDEELIAVLAHEAGHVANRHGMRSSLQASAVGVLAALVVGDVSSVSSAVTALPLILTELGYSRGFEQEADRYALETLERHGIASQRFADILRRLDGNEEEAGVGAYLSSHPPTVERTRLIEQQK